MILWFLVLNGIISLILSCRSSAELITALPGQPTNISFKQHSGYIITDAQHGRALFYYFVEADSANPLSHPLTLWLNGGPGCSSLGFGAFMEHGPFRPGDDGNLIKNNYSWNLESNMLYVEAPVGVGFSYSNTSSDYINWNDTKTGVDYIYGVHNILAHLICKNYKPQFLCFFAAQENLQFILNWFKEFPKYRDLDLYLTGESYAGHYVPQVAVLLLDYNQQSNARPINLKAIALGNPLLDIEISSNNAEYLWSHGAISDETLVLKKTICNDTRYMTEAIHNNLSKECTDVFNKMAEEVGDYTNVGNLLSPFCLSRNVAAQSVSGEARDSIHAKLASITTNGDPCLGEKILLYLNNPHVQKALHANTTHLPFLWDFCTGPLSYQRDNLAINTIPLISELVEVGIRVLLYSGDQDSKIPLTQTRIIANMLARDLKLTSIKRYGPWYDKMQVGGWTQSFGRLRKGKNVTYLTFATVRGAAHEVPFTSPSQALTLFRSFLKGSALGDTISIAG